MDAIDARILEILQENARVSVSEISQRINLSRPSVNERITRMVESGVIDGFTAIVPPHKIGYEVSFFIQISDLKVPWQRMEEMLEENPYVTEFHRVTGNANYIVKASASNIEAMNDMLATLMKHGHAVTSIILKSPIVNNPLRPL